MIHDTKRQAMTGHGLVPRLLRVIGAVLVLVLPRFADAWTSPCAANSKSPATVVLHHHPTSIPSRREAFASIPLFLIGAVITVAPDPTNALLLSKQQPPLQKGITTVILDSADSKLGVKLEDVVLGKDQTVYPVVQSVASDGVASTEGVVPGMVVLGGWPSSKSLVQRLQRGPYPFAVQFYDLSVELQQEEGGGSSSSAMMAMGQAKNEASQSRAAQSNEPQLSSKGAGLGVKTIRKVSGCTVKAKRGDTVQITYEARVASPGGPIYDSTADRGGKPVTFQLGDGKALPGVEIGMDGMCKGEVRELDIPSSLGYGRFGSEVFDVPGDVRLWWRIELLDLVEGERTYSIF